MKLQIKNITIIVTDPAHPINPWLEQWKNQRPKDQDVQIINSIKDSQGGDICFLVSCNEIVPPEFIETYRYVLVIHASDLPKGRGWSPHIWQILDGETKIVLSLLEASEEVDRGDIWHQSICSIPKNYLFNGIMKVLNKAHIEMMTYALENHSTIKPKKQPQDIIPTYFPKRKPEDSEISVSKSIEDQFDLLRVADVNRFPSFFFMHGKKYKITVEEYEE